MTRTERGAWPVVVAGGIMAAVHIWKLSSALPVMRAELGLSLVLSGILLSLIQAAGIVLGIAASFLGELFTSRRTMVAGLLFLAAGSILTGLFPTVPLVLIGRFVEGIGFVMAAVMGPALVRELTTVEDRDIGMGWWAGFQGIACLVGVIATVAAMFVMPWQLWWVIIGLVTAGMAALVAWRVPRTPSPHASTGPAPTGQAPAAQRGSAPASWAVPASDTKTNHLRSSLRRTALTASVPRVWFAGLAFACYTAQWISIIGFLPTLYEEHGLDRATGGLLTAVVGGLNAAGAIISGRVLQHVQHPWRMVAGAFVIMGAAAFVTFAFDYPGGWVVLQASAVGLLSLAGAAVPTVLTRMSGDLAPPGGAPSAAMGVMQQLFNVGSFLGPMALAAMVSAAGSWHVSWWLTTGLCVTGIIFASTLRTVAERPR